MDFSCFLFLVLFDKFDFATLFLDVRVELTFIDFILVGNFSNIDVVVKAFDDIIMKFVTITTLTFATFLRRATTFLHIFISGF